MKKFLFLSFLTGSALLALSGCAESSYNSAYNNYNSYDNKMDRVAQSAANDAASQLSAQDIKNLNNLK